MMSNVEAGARDKVISLGGGGRYIWAIPSILLMPKNVANYVPTILECPFELVRRAWVRDGNQPPM